MDAGKSVIGMSFDFESDLETIGGGSDLIARDLRGFPLHSVAFQPPGSVMVRNCAAAAFRNSCTVSEGSIETDPPAFRQCHGTQFVWTTR